MTPSKASGRTAPPSVTEEEIVEMWLHGMAQNTQKSYRSDLAQFAAFTGGKPVGEVTLADLQGFDGLLEESGRAASTRARKLSTLKSFYKFAALQEFCKSDPAAALRLPKVKNTQASRILTVEQVRLFLAAAKSRVPQLPAGKALFTMPELIEVFRFRGRSAIDRAASEGGWSSVVKGASVLCRLPGRRSSWRRERR